MVVKAQFCKNEVLFWPLEHLCINVLQSVTTLIIALNEDVLAMRSKNMI